MHAYILKFSSYTVSLFLVLVFSMPQMWRVFTNFKPPPKQNTRIEQPGTGTGSNSNNINNDRQCCINKSKFNDKQNISCHAYQITRFLYEPADDSPQRQSSVYIQIIYVFVCVVRAWLRTLQERLHLSLQLHLQLQLESVQLHVAQYMTKPLVSFECECCKCYECLATPGEDAVRCWCWKVSPLP